MSDDATNPGLAGGTMRADVDPQPMGVPGQRDSEQRKGGLVREELIVAQSRKIVPATVAILGRRPEVAEPTRTRERRLEIGSAQSPARDAECSGLGDAEPRTEYLRNGIAHAPSVDGVSR